MHADSNFSFYFCALYQGKPLNKLTGSFLQFNQKVFALFSDEMKIHRASFNVFILKILF